MMTERIPDDPSNAPTCGKGLAYHARLPAMLGMLMAGMGDVLDHHTKALDPTDPRAKPEHEAYRRLVEQHQMTAAALRATAAEMAGYRDLPMGPHDMDAMMHPDARMIFARLVGVEEELSALLQIQLEEHRAMLRDMP